MYKRRLIILLCFFAAGVVVLVTRLGWMQLVRGDYYRGEAEKSLRSVELLDSSRGRILDRTGRVLAVDEACFDFCLDYRLISGNARWRRSRIRQIRKDIGKSGDGSGASAEKMFGRRVDYTLNLARRLAAEFGGDVDRRIERIIRKVGMIRRTVGRTVREERIAHVVVAGLDEQTAGGLRELMAGGKTVGARIRPSHRRTYPCRDSACHVIGVTGPVYREDAEKHNLRADEASWLRRSMTNYLPGDTIGRTGVERAAERRLRPKRGYISYSAPGVVAETVAARKGDDVRLSIDILLQRRLEQVFDGTGHTGAIVVLDVATGEILAMVSRPGYDLNEYWRRYRELSRDRRNLPLVPRAVSAAYAPGSTMKPITALAALGEGAINLNTLIHCDGSNPRSSQGIPHCWIHEYNVGHGSLNVVEALCHSCNVFFVEAAHRLGAASLSKWFRFFGFGASPNTGLPSEKGGGAGSEAWMRSHFGRGYVPSDAWFMAIGQGAVHGTCLQVCAAMGAIARDGVYISPRLFLTGGPAPLVRRLQLAESHLKAVRKGMYQVVNDSRGTAYKSWRTGPSLSVVVCGKTGTAEVPPMRVDSDGDGRVTSADRIVKEGAHAWFAGFAPYRHPRISFAVLVEYAGSGGKNAAPVAKETVRWCGRMGYLSGSGG